MAKTGNSKGSGSSRSTSAASSARSGSRSASKAGSRSGSSARSSAAKTVKKTAGAAGANKADDLRISAEEYAKLERSVSREGKISRIVLGIILLAVAAFLMVSIYFPYAGKVGEILEYACMGLFGFMGYLLPFFFALFSGLVFINRAGELGKLPTVIFIVVLFIMASACYAIHCLTDVAGTKFGFSLLKQFWIDGIVKSEGGGLLGSGLAFVLSKLMGTAGAYIVTIAGMIICLIITINKPLEWLLSNFNSFRRNRKDARDSIKEDKLAAKEAAREAALAESEESALEPVDEGGRDYAAEAKAMAGQRAILSATEKKKQRDGKWKKYAGYFDEDTDKEYEAVRSEAEARRISRRNSHSEGDTSMLDEDAISFGVGGKAYVSGNGEEILNRPSGSGGLYRLGLSSDPFGEVDYGEAPVNNRNTFMGGIDNPYAGDDQLEEMEKNARIAADNLNQDLNVPDFNLETEEEKQLSGRDTLNLKRTGKFVPGSAGIYDMVSEEAPESGIVSDDIGSEDGPAYSSEGKGLGVGSGLSAGTEAAASGPGTRAASELGSAAGLAAGAGSLGSAAALGAAGAAIAGTTKNKPTTGKSGSNDDKLPYVLPPLSLLRGGGGDKTANTSLELRQKGQLLEKTLHSFNVNAKVVNVEKGPSVTRFEVQPDVGVKVSSIVRLQDDIALNLRAKSIRLEAPIPGKAAIGIEIENEHKNPVYLKEVIDSPQFKKSRSKITFAVGRDISGNPVVANLKDMPHLLIAGSTGSGKSVCINSIILSILYKARPDEVKLVMIDPKVVELGNYNGIPHLMIPVVNEPSKAAVALNWAVKEMEERYRKFSDNNVKEIASYNEKAKNDPDLVKMPQIVIIIDELADLMMAAPQQVEDSICRLAQMARAAGMHLIVATQRPSVDVITGVIKANMPSRIAFAVSSQVDSRTILDSSGAEKLLGKGDMLFNPLGMGKPLRVQGTFVTEEETMDVIGFVSGQYGHEADFSNDLMDTIQTQSPGFDDEEADDLLADAIEMVIEMQQASASMIQRKFRVGYNRAARMVDMMEERGIVSPADGSRPRNVLLTKEEFEALKSGRSAVDYSDDYEGGEG